MNTETINDDYRAEDMGDHEWIITHKGEHFTGGPNVYPSHAACQTAINRLRSASPAIIQAAMKVVSSWESGDLAGAVRSLDQALAGAWRRS